jgi:3-methyladenine DNA glycosylase/8-oxoguanine DNA glycosylase
MPRPTHAEASAALARIDPTMSGLVRRHGPMHLPRPVKADRRFEQLAESIAYQQLAGRAAATIWGRFRALYGPGPLDPEDVLATPLESLRAAGLSGSKSAALVDLARHVANGTLTLERAGRLSDEELTAQLVQVRGIGPWTAQMFLLFTLQRLDVWPVGDYGVRTGYGIAYGLSEAPTPGALEELGDRFRPYRSVAAWYCWRALESPGGRA